MAMADSLRIVIELNGSATLRAASQALSRGVRGLSLGPFTNRSYAFRCLGLQGAGAGCTPAPAAPDPEPATSAFAPAGGCGFEPAPDVHGAGFVVGLEGGVCGAGASGSPSPPGFDAAASPASCPAASRIAPGEYAATTSARSAQCLLFARIPLAAC